MTKIDIISGFLGAGKTTLIQKLLKEALKGEQVVLIENEFGEIGIDGGFLKEAGIEIREMNSGCICCSLVGDFGTSLKEVIEKYAPERILIEPSGVGKLSDVIKAVADLELNEAEVGKVANLNTAVAVVDVNKCKMYIKNFGEFFINQIENAGTIILSRTGTASEAKVIEATELLRKHNAKATIITTAWEEIDGKQILNAMEAGDTLEQELLEAVRREHEEHEHCHHDHEHEEHEHCHHDHEHEEHEHCHHDHEHEEHEHHDHDHGPDCTCGCHDHDHHHADEVFTSWGMETPIAYSKDALEVILGELEKETFYGQILRAKGMVAAKEGGFWYFDYVPGESDVRAGEPCVTGKLCVIGAELKEERIKELFGV